MSRRRGTPAWFVFISSIAFVFGLYYLWQGAQTYLSTGGLGVVAATEQAVIISTATAVQRATNAIPTQTLIPTFTPPPPCQEWVVNVPSAIVRLLPDTTSPIVDSLDGGTEVCVIERIPDTLWYKIDSDPQTRRIDEAYMRGDIIRPLNPTPTPTQPATALPTVTPLTPTITETPGITSTPNPDATTGPSDTPPPTAPPTITSTPIPIQSI